MCYHLGKKGKGLIEAEGIVKTEPLDVVVFLRGWGGGVEETGGTL